MDQNLVILQDNASVYKSLSTSNQLSENNIKLCTVQLKVSILITQKTQGKLSSSSVCQRKTPVWKHGSKYPFTHPNTWVNLCKSMFWKSSVLRGSKKVLKFIYKPFTCISYILNILVLNFFPPTYVIQKLMFAFLKKHNIAF